MKDFEFQPIHVFYWVLASLLRFLVAWEFLKNNSGQASPIRMRRLLTN